MNTDLEKTGENDVGVAINNAFNYISMNKQAYDGLAFITDLYSRLEEGDDLDVAHVRETFMESYGSDVKMVDVFGEDSEYDVGRQLAAEFIEKTGLPSLPQVSSWVTTIKGSSWE